MSKTEMISKERAGNEGVCTGPGASEAAEILKDLKEAEKGLIAWVRVGLRLVDVKGRLPHGEFMKWVDSNFQRAGNLRDNPNLQRAGNLRASHLFEAKRVAAALLDFNDLGWEDALKVAENPAHSVWRFVEQQSGRSLGRFAKNLKEPSDEDRESEAKAKSFCEDWWKRNPEDRDEYEEKVLSGASSYIDAKRAMIGADATKGKPRKVTDYFDRLYKNFTGSARHFPHYQTLAREEKEAVVEAAIKMASACPDELAEVIRKNLPTQ